MDLVSGVIGTKCPQCAGLRTDATPGVMTWDELLDHMDNLVGWGQDQINTWTQSASALQMS